MKIVECELEVDWWTHIIYSRHERSAENEVVDTHARDYEELRVHDPNTSSFPHIYHQFNVSTYEGGYVIERL